MAEFMQKFDKNNDGRIELSEVRNCIVPKIKSVANEPDKVRLQIVLKMADI